MFYVRKCSKCAEGKPRWWVGSPRARVVHGIAVRYAGEAVCGKPVGRTWVPYDEDGLDPPRMRDREMTTGDSKGKGVILCLRCGRKLLDHKLTDPACLP